MPQNWLAKLEQAAEGIPDSYPPDNEDLIQPDFSSYYEANRASRIRYWAHELNLLKPPPFSADHFYKLLLDQEEIPLPLSIPFEGRFILFGDLRGAFHSLTRCLKKLASMEIIDSGLAVINPKDRLIFNGNFIGASHTNIELLALLLFLQKKNPQQVIILAGSHEKKGEWRNFDLKRALMTRCRYYSKEFIPLAEEIDSWVAALPEKLIVETPKGEIGILPSEVEHEAPLLAAVRGLLRAYFYSPEIGFEAIPGKKGESAWSVFSSPTYINENLYEFKSDSFALLETRDWKWTHYTKPKHAKAFIHRSYHFLTQDAVEKVARIPRPSTLLGVTLDLSESSLGLGLRLREGIDLAVNQLKQENFSKELRPIYLDDKYTPSLSKQNILRFLKEYKTELIFSPLGTPTTSSYLPLIESGEIAVFFPCSGASIFRRPGLDHIIHFRSSYKLEAQSLIRYAQDQLQIKRFAFFYQNDSYGEAPLKGALELLEKKEGVEWIEASYVRNNPNVEKAAKQIEEFDPEAIFFFSTYAPSRALIHILNVFKLSGKFLFGISFLTDLFRDFCKLKGLNFVISRVVPSFENTEIEMVDKFNREYAARYGGDTPSVDTFEGYINIQLFAELIRRTEGSTRKEDLLAAARSFEDELFLGLKLDYSSQTHELFHSVWVDPGDGSYICFDAEQI